MDEGFSGEPLTASCGIQPGPDQSALARWHVADAAAEQAASGRPISAVVRAGRRIVAAVVGDAPAKGRDPGTFVPPPPAAHGTLKRLVAAMEYVDTLAIPALAALGGAAGGAAGGVEGGKGGRQPAPPLLSIPPPPPLDELPEFSLGTVVPELRGALVDVIVDSEEELGHWEPPEGRPLRATLIQLLLRAGEIQTGRYYRGVYSYSNDLSWPRQKDMGGWVRLVTLPYAGLPRDLAPTPVKGDMHFLYRPLPGPGSKKQLKGWRLARKGRGGVGEGPKGGDGAGSRSKL